MIADSTVAGEGVETTSTAAAGRKNKVRVNCVRQRLGMGHVRPTVPSVVRADRKERVYHSPERKQRPPPKGNTSMKHAAQGSVGRVDF